MIKQKYHISLFYISNSKFSFIIEFWKDKIYNPSVSNKKTIKLKD